MRLWHRARELMWTLFRPGRVDRDLDDELNDWIETLAARHRQKGASAEEARRLAHIEIGGVAQAKEHALSIRNGIELESTTMDCRYAMRALRRTPGFTAAAVLTFALGVGATTAIFSVVKAVLLEPLPYRDADRLAFIWSDVTDLGYPHAPLAGPELAEFQQRATSFEQLGGVWATNATLGGVRDPEQLRLATVTPDFFPVLGVEAALGHALTRADFGQQVTPMLLSHSLWTRSFGADPLVVGRRITLNDRPAVVVGVMPRTFELLFPPDSAVPADLEAWMPGSLQFASEPRGQQYLRVVGRLKSGVSMKAAIEEVAGVGASILSAHQTSYTPGWRFYAIAMKEDNVRQLRPAMLAIFGGVLILLAIACVNIAGLLTVRTSQRRRETSLRLALGASQSRLWRQCLIEGLLLCAIGGGLGVVVAYGGVQALVRLAPDSLARIQSAELDLGVLTFAGIASITWGIAFSMLPWLEVRRVDLVSIIQPGTRAAGSLFGSRVRSALIVAQLALGVVLMVGAALLGRTFWHLLRLDPGFRAEQALTFRVAPPFQRYRPLDGMNAFHRTLSERLSALPGVVDVGSMSHLPYDHLPNWATPYLPLEEKDETKAGLADTRSVSPDLFTALGATLLSGRVFSEGDVRAAEMPAIVDELLARRLFGSSEPLDRVFRVDLGGSGQMAPMRVVGVVRHLRHRTLTDPGREQLFVPSRQWPRNPASYVVRTSGDPMALVPAVREVVRSLDPALPVYDIQPLDAYMTTARAPGRFTMFMALTFAGVALVLACVGAYGVVAYAVGQRMTEFGIRRALGAAPREIVGLALRDAARLAAAGLILGAATTTALAHLLQALLFEVAATDPLSYAVAILTLAAAVLAASWMPAHRAATASPVTILRNET